MTGTLYIVATPIGNLSDLTERARITLESVDWILAEDTRVTLKLLSLAGLNKSKLISYHEHSSEKKNEMILANLQKGQSYALVSDAGTPAVSDPGSRLVGLVRENAIPVVPIPGASAVTTILSVFGKPFSSFHFWGFFPMKKKKQEQLVTYFQDIPGIHVFFESPYRLEKTFLNYLIDLEGYFVLIGREMTKKFESFYAGSPRQAIDKVLADQVKGEFCVALAKLKNKDR